MRLVVPFELNFFAGSHYEEYKDLNPRRTPQTCEWCLQHHKFKRWRDSSHDDLLLITADPGCGKSVLSRALVDEKLVGADVTICYFFFKDGNNQQDNCAAAACALLHQLFSQRHDLLEKYAEPMRKKHGDGLKLRFKLLWELFVSSATDPSAGDLVCILDALDESLETDQKELIRCLDQFYSRPMGAPADTRARSKLKFLITSRPYRGILLGFHNLLSSSEELHLAADDDKMNTLDREILHHIQDKVKDLAARLRLNTEIEEILHDRFCNMPHRTYLWAHLMMDELESVYVKGIKRPRDLTEVIDVLPTSVEDAYEKILSRCDRATARPVLEIIIAAQRPLSLSEIDGALRIRPDMRSSINTAREGDQASKEWLRAACGCFVQISDGRVFLIHQTAREFLMNKTKQSVDSGKWRYSVRPQEANHRLAAMCMSQLTCRNAQFIDPDEGFEHPWGSKRREVALQHLDKHPFLEYSVNFWALHVGEAGMNGISFMPETLKLCDPDEEVFQTWTSLAHHFDPFQEEKLDQCRRSSLHCAIELGLYLEVETLLCRLLRRDGPGDWFRFTMHAVAKHAHLREHGPTDWFWDAMEVAATHPKFGRRLIRAFLSQLGRKPLKKRVLEAVARNRGQAFEIMELLFDKYNNQVKITEEVTCAAARNESQGLELMNLMFEARANRIAITQDTTIATAINTGQGAVIMKPLLDKCHNELEVTSSVIEAAAGNRGQGEEIMKLILSECKNRAKVTQKAVANAAENTVQGAAIMKLLLDKCHNEPEVTSTVIEAAAGNWGQGEEIMRLILSECRNRAKVTQEAVANAAKNSQQGDKIIELLLDGCKNEIAITQRGVDKIVENEGKGDRTMELLLDKRGNDIEITQRFVEDVVRYSWLGDKIMEVLLNRRRDDFKITQEVTKAAVGSYRAGYGIMRLFIDRCKDEIEITQEVIRIAAGNEDSGYEIMQLLFDRYGDEIKITQEVINEAAGNKGFGDKIMQLLVDMCKNRIKITQKVVEVAVENEYLGYEIMKLLFHNQVEIMPGLIKPAFHRCRHCQEEFLKLFHDYNVELLERPIESDSSTS